MPSASAFCGSCGGAAAGARPLLRQSAPQRRDQFVELLHHAVEIRRRRRVAGDHRKRVYAIAIGRAIPHRRRERTAEPVIELREAPEVTGTEVGKFMLLPAGPEPSGARSPAAGSPQGSAGGRWPILHRVEFGGVGRQAAGEDFAFQRFEIFADGGGAMDGGAVPGDQQLAGRMALQMSEELEDLRALDAAGKEPAVEVCAKSARRWPRGSSS